jgi:hypothetical protein
MVEIGSRIGFGSWVDEVGGFGAVVDGAGSLHCRPCYSEAFFGRG